MELNHIMPSEKDLEKNRLLCILEGATARTIFNLTSGAFLVGLLKYIGASDKVCGYIMAIPVLAAVIQFLSPIILESLKYRKNIITLGCLIHRFLLAALIVVPFLPMSVPAKLWLAGIMFFLSYLAVSFINPAVSNMYVSFVPQNIRGRYFGTRESYLLLSTTIVSLILGKVLDIYEEAGQDITGYLIIYGVVLVFAIINTFTFYKMKEVPLVHTTERIRIREIFTLPFKNKLFINFFIMSIIWNIAIQIAGAFFGVYLVSDLDMNYTTITLLGMVNSTAYILAARMWGKYADKRGWPITTLLSIGLLGICHTIWFFSFQGSPILIILLTLGHITGGLAWSGINVALFNLQFEFTPDEKRTVYIGFSAAASGIIGYMAAMIGSQLVGWFENTKINLFAIHFNIKQILFMASAALLFTCAAYIFIFMRKKHNQPS